MGESGDGGVVGPGCGLRDIDGSPTSFRWRILAKYRVRVRLLEFVSR